MCKKGLATSIGQLCRLSGDSALLLAKLRESPMGMKCLLLDKPLQDDVPVIAVIAGSGRNAIFRLVQLSAIEDIGMVQQPISLIQNEATLQRALAIVLACGVLMGSEKYVHSKVFPQKEQPSKPRIKIVPPKITKKKVVLRREPFSRDRAEAQMRPLS